MRPRMPYSPRSFSYSLRKTPAFAHWLSLRQQVMPLTPKTSAGRSSHAMPVFSTKRMLRRAARSSAYEGPCAVATALRQQRLYALPEGLWHELTLHAPKVRIPPSDCSPTPSLVEL